MKRIAITGAGLVMVLAFAWWIFPPDPARVLRSHAAPLDGVTRTSVPELGAGLERWNLRDRDGREAAGLWRAAPPGTSSPWTVVLLGGIGTGERAARLIPEHVPVNVLAMAWPWDGPLRLTAWDVVRRLGAMRTAALRSPAVLALGMEAVTRQPEVDPERVVLVGASLGVPPAVAALRVSDVPSALVLVDGAADLVPVLDQALRREHVKRPWSTILASIAHRLGRPLEPSLHGGAAEAMPVLILSARDEDLMPRASVLRLHETFPNAEVRWLEGEHMRPERAEVVGERIREAVAWLEGRAGLDR